MDVVDTHHDGGGDEERWGLVWDPEEGPVWGKIGGVKEENEEDTWTQLLREGVSGITTDSNGEDLLHHTSAAPRLEDTLTRL